MGKLSWLVVLGLAVASRPAAAQLEAEPSPAAVGREVERVLGQSHQRTLPGFDPEPGDRAGRPRPARELDRSALRRGDRRIDPRTGRPRAPVDRARGNTGGAPDGPLSGIATMLLWGMLAAVAVVLGVAIYRQAAGYTGDDQPEPPRKLADDQLAAVIERPRDDADELAAQARFADAIHTLLLRTLHELASQHLVRVIPAMTSREILARVSLLGDAREGLAGLIVAVEQTWFGDDVPQLADYDRCRAQFDRFAAAYRRGAGARP